MNTKMYRRIMMVLVAILVIIPLTSSAQQADDFGKYERAQYNTGDPNNFQLAITGSGVSGVHCGLETQDCGPASQPSAHLVHSASLPPTNLVQADYQEIYDEAMSLLNEAKAFRSDNLQVTLACEDPSGEDCLQNYEDFNDGQLFYDFCANHLATVELAVSANGYCPKNDASGGARPNYRNQLLRAREGFAYLTVAEPSDMQVCLEWRDVNTDPPTRECVQDKQISAHAVGQERAREATREIANVHLIFGNEFMVDALDYRFGGDNPEAEAIIRKEYEQLYQAYIQFKMAVDVMGHAFNADFGGPFGRYIGDFFGQDEYDLFGIASERMVLSMDEMAQRCRILNGCPAVELNDSPSIVPFENAQAIYKQGFVEQYAQALALTNSRESKPESGGLVDNGGWKFISNLDRLYQQSQAVKEGINPLGYRPEYVPLQTYDELRTDVISEFLVAAEKDEEVAKQYQLTFEQNDNALRTELQNIRSKYNAQLLTLCGQSSGLDENGLDNYGDCTGGAMQQNFDALTIALANIRAARQSVDSIRGHIKIENDSAEQEIQIVTAKGVTIGMLQYQQGIENAFRTTSVNSVSRTDEKFGSSTKSNTFYIDTNVKVSGKGGFNPLKWDFGAEASVTTGDRFEKVWQSGSRWANTTVNSTSQSIDLGQIRVGELQQLQQLRETMAQADLIGVQNKKIIRKMLLEQAEKLIQVDIAYKQMDRLINEHNQLATQYRFLLNERERALAHFTQDYRTNPAWRILRNHHTLQAARSLDVAQQYAYLVAKAYEYRSLEPYNGLSDIYKARTAGEVGNFLRELHSDFIGISKNYTCDSISISAANDIFKIDGYDGMSSSQQLAAFQEQLQLRMVLDEVSGDPSNVRIPFITSLEDDTIFSRNVWNQRIAGVGVEPDGVTNAKGLRVTLSSNAATDQGSPKILIRHDGVSTFRSTDGSIVEYTPTNARLVGYQAPDWFEDAFKWASVEASINGNNRGSMSNEFVNRSASTSDWLIYIDLIDIPNQKLDITQVRDIELQMDVYGFTGVPDGVQAASAPFSSCPND